MEMFHGKECNCYTKAVLAVMIGENIINVLPVGEGYQFSRKALDVCWSWVQKRDAVELEEINYICSCLDSEDGVDFLFYMDGAENEVIKSIYIILIEITAYIGAQAVLGKNLSLPQYLESFEEEKEYQEMLCDNMNQIDKDYYEKMKISQIADYCDSQLKENHDARFDREEMLKLFEG